MIRQMLIWTVSTTVAFGLLAGCAGGSGVSVPQFPGREAVAQMKSTDAPERYFDGERISVDTWKMEGPLPDQLGHVAARPQTHLDERLHTLVANVDPVDTIVSKQMNCAARQLGLFRIEHGASPEPMLKSYLNSRCGVPDTRISVHRWSWDDVADVSDRELIDGLWSDEEDQKSLRQHVEGDNKAVGAALVRRDSRALLMLTYNTRNVDLEPQPLVQPEGDTIELRGRILSRKQAPTGEVTIGPFDAADCERRDDVEPPQFHFRCPRSPEDSSTRIELSQAREDSIFGQIVLGARVWRNADQADVFNILPIGAIVASTQKRLSESSKNETSVKIGSKEAMKRFVTLLNEVRDQAGLKPVVLHADQSREVRRLAGQLMVPTNSPEEAGQERRKSTERVIRGLMAGWEIDDPVSDSTFRIASVSEPTVGTVLAYALDSPSGRTTLLAEGYDTLAAAIVPDKSGDGAGFAGFTYKGVPEAKFSERRSTVVDQINAERQARGIPEFDVDGATFVDCRRVAQRLEAGSLGLRQAQKRLMEYAVEKWGTRVSSNLMVTQSLEDLTVPSRLLDVGISKAALVVAPFQPEGAAWTSYAIMWVIPSGQTA